jgi:hypothetical protein
MKSNHREIHADVKQIFYFLSFMSTTASKRKDSKRKDDKSKHSNKSNRKHTTKKKTSLDQKQTIDQLVEARVQKLTGKTTAHVSLELKYGEFVPRMIPTSKNSKLNFLITGAKKFLAQFDGTPKGTLRERRSSLSRAQDGELASFIREMSTFLFGTQEPRLRLPSTGVTISIASGIIHDELGIGWGNINSAILSDLAGLFDEVKVIEGVFHYVSERIAAADALIHKCVGVIDYETNTSLANFANGLSYDTHKVFSYDIVPSESRCEWHWKSQGIPDLSWIPTSDTSTMVAYWKSYIRSTDSGSVGVGFTYFTATCDFRQVSAV